MSWKASVARGAAIAWAIILIGMFVVFAGVSLFIPSTKSGRINLDRDIEEGPAPAVAPDVAPAT